MSGLHGLILVQLLVAGINPSSRPWYSQYTILKDEMWGVFPRT